MKFILSLLILSFFSASLALAETSQLLIQDLAGATRLVSEVAGSSNLTFGVELSGAPANAVVVTLTNTLTGEVISATSVNGQVVFSDLAAGTYTISSLTTGVVFTTASIVEIPPWISPDTTLLIGRSLIAAGIVGGATVAIVESSDGGPHDLSPAS